MKKYEAFPRIKWPLLFKSELSEKNTLKIVGWGAQNPHLSIEKIKQ